MARTPRREFSAATRRAAWERSGGLCEGWIADIGRCNAPLRNKAHFYDHIDPDWFSKDNELENCQVLCFTCNYFKTPIDQRNIAKSKRLIDKRIKARKPRGRPMPGTKRSGLRKRMDGTVERT